MSLACAVYLPTACPSWYAWFPRHHCQVGCHCLPAPPFVCLQASPFACPQAHPFAFLQAPPFVCLLAPPFACLLACCLTDPAPHCYLTAYTNLRTIRYPKPPPLMKAKKAVPNPVKVREPEPEPKPEPEPEPEPELKTTPPQPEPELEKTTPVSGPETEPESENNAASATFTVVLPITNVSEARYSTLRPFTVLTADGHVSCDLGGDVSYVTRHNGTRTLAHARTCLGHTHESASVTRHTHTNDIRCRACVCVHSCIIVGLSFSPARAALVGTSTALPGLPLFHHT